MTRHIRLRSILIAIAFLGLILALVVQERRASQREWELQTELQEARDQIMAAQYEARLSRIRQEEAERFARGEPLLGSETGTIPTFQRSESEHAATIPDRLGRTPAEKDDRARVTEPPGDPP